MFMILLNDMNIMRRLAATRIIELWWILRLYGYLMQPERCSGFPVEHFISDQQIIVYGLFV
jgi:hypothetical protein